MNESDDYILVVDDDPDVRAYLGSLLGHYNYSVITCQSAAEALSHLEDTPVAGVLTDIKMPAVSGIELLEQIRDYNPEIPVIVMTGYADVDTAIDPLDKGAFHFITKPFKHDFLIRAVDGCCWWRPKLPFPGALEAHNLKPCSKPLSLSLPWCWQRWLRCTLAICQEPFNSIQLHLAACSRASAP